MLKGIRMCYLLDHMLLVHYMVWMLGCLQSCVMMAEVMVLDVSRGG